MSATPPPTNAGYLRFLLAVAGAYDAARLAKVTSGFPQWNPCDFALLSAREVAGQLIAGLPIDDGQWS